MTKKELLKKLKTAKAKHDARELSYLRNDETYTIREFKPRVKYYTRLNTFKGSNHEFNPESMVATSYQWWTFVKIIKGKLVFNDYRYSNSTSKHQGNVGYLLRQLGLKTIDVCQRQSLSDGVKVGHLYEEMFKAQIHNANPKTRSKYDKGYFTRMKKRIELARSLGAKFSRQLQKDLKAQLVKDEAYRIAHLKEQCVLRKKILTDAKNLLKVSLEPVQTEVA